MSTTVHIDKIEDLAIEERFGVLQRLVRRYIVTGITDNDYQALLAALAATGVPVAYDQLPIGYNLICTGRSVKMVDIHTAHVDVTYEHYHNEGQSFDAPPVGVMTGELRVSIQQVDTDKDENGDRILLSHTYPADDPDYAGETKEQVGEIKIMDPQRVQTYNGIKQTETPWLIANQIVGYVNSSSWSAGEARTWMCTGCTWKLADATPDANRFFMTFEFQHNPDTWDPTAVFIDDRTSKPPKNLVAGTGYKTIKRAPECDFENVIGTILQGG